ncbi:alpha/beta hydrolase [Paragemmobacter straminiformis]|uniref:Dienelactone hydrolase family protein n=1 Tax=Paragemmobacter straminiformis TaxID=2045119 RepID=A0A842IC52_9RHOB|nr:dienelactone hydrolase family protein [Gemmobacter straminiformis]MBC2837156.1 dienelactone hydrolase family protein [Gemmobacter straminiformis]
MTHLAIFLHGVGAHGSSIAWMADHLALPGLAFAAPDAPFAFDASPAGPARQWFSVAGVTAENRPARIAAARAPFDETLRAQMAAHGISDPARVALIGFSQGAIMALDAVATGRWQVGALVAFSGRLASAPPLAPAACPILIAHGLQDSVIPASEARAARAALAAAGADADLILEDRVGHAPGPQGLAAARTLLARWMEPASV